MKKTKAMTIRVDEKLYKSIRVQAVRSGVTNGKIIEQAFARGRKMERLVKVIIKDFDEVMGYPG